MTCNLIVIYLQAMARGVSSDVVPFNVYMYVVCAVIDLLVRLRANTFVCFSQHFHSVFLTPVKMKVSVFHLAAPILAIADLGFISWENVKMVSRLGLVR